MNLDVLSFDRRKASQRRGMKPLERGKRWLAMSGEDGRVTASSVGTA